MKVNPKNLFRIKPLSEEAFAEIFEAFYFLREAEIPEKEALTIIAEEQTKPAVKNFLASLLNAPSFIEGLREFPQFAPDYMMALLAQGQKNNEEIKVLKSISEHLVKLLLLDDENGSYKKQLKKYLNYPWGTLIVAFMVSTVLLVFVVPVFDEVFVSFGAELPVLTRYIVRLSEFMQTWWWVCIGIILFGKYCFMHPINKSIRSKLALYFSVVVYAETSATIRTLHLLLSYGVYLQEALCLSATASQNVIISRALIKSANALTEKESFVDCLKQQGIFPNKVLQSLRVFEKTNRLILLDRLVNRMSFNIKSNIKGSAKKMNSVIMVILGLTVGILIIAMYLPIFSMGAAVG